MPWPHSSESSSLCEALPPNARQPSLAPAAPRHQTRCIRTPFSSLSRLQAEQVSGEDGRVFDDPSLVRSRDCGLHFFVAHTADGILQLLFQLFHRGTSWFTSYRSSEESPTARGVVSPSSPG